MKQFPRLVFTQLLLSNNVVEQLAFRSKLQDQVNVVAFSESIFEAKDVGVADAHQNANLLLQAFRLGLVLFGAGMLGEDLDGISLAS